MSWTITRSGDNILLNDGVRILTARRTYISMYAYGDRVAFLWHVLEYGSSRLSRRRVDINYNSVTTPAAISAADLMNKVQQLISQSEAITSADITDSTAVGRNLLTLSNPSAIRWLRVNENNTVTARTASQTLSDIGVKAAITSVDYTNNSNVLTSISGLSFSVDASAAYYFEVSGSMTSGNTSGLRLGISVPSDSTVAYELWGNNSSASNFQSKSESYSGGEITLTICAAAAVRLGFRIFGTLTTGVNAGTMQMQARAVSTGYTITIHSGARLLAVKI